MTAEQQAEIMRPRKYPTPHFNNFFGRRVWPVPVFKVCTPIRTSRRFRHAVPSTRVAQRADNCRFCIHSCLLALHCTLWTP